MDTQIVKLKADCKTLDELSRHRVVVGARQLKRALEDGRATAVFLARNADPAITEPLEAMCRRKAVRCVWVDSKNDLGQACGIEVGAAAAAAVD